MDSHRIPMFSQPTRFGRLKPGFYVLTEQFAPPPEGLQIVSQWSMDAQPWQDEIGDSDFTETANPLALVTGFENSAAGFTTEYASLNAPVRTMNVADWEIEFYLYFDDFSSVNNNLIAYVATYGNANLNQYEWRLIVEQPVLGEYRLYLDCPSFTPAPYVVISPATWHFVRFGLELNDLPAPNRIYISLDGGVPEQEFIPGDSPVIAMTNIYAGSLTLGLYGLFNTCAAGMRIDEMVLRMEYFFVPPPPEPVLVHHWPMESLSWTDIIDGNDFTLTGAASLASGFSGQSALFTPTGSLTASVPVFAGDSWEIEFYLYFSDVNNFPQDIFLSNIIHATLESTGGIVGTLSLSWDAFGSFSFNNSWTSTVQASGPSSVTWHHIRFGYRNTVGQNYLSIDGAESTAPADPATPGSFEWTSATLRLGYLDEFTPALDGMRIDELRLKRII